MPGATVSSFALVICAGRLVWDFWQSAYIAQPTDRLLWSALAFWEALDAQSTCAAAPAEEFTCPAPEAPELEEPLVSSTILYTVIAVLVVLVIILSCCLCRRPRPAPLGAVVTRYDGSGAGGRGPRQSSSRALRE